MVLLVWPYHSMPLQINATHTRERPTTKESNALITPTVGPIFNFYQLKQAEKLKQVFSSVVSLPDEIYLFHDASFS